MAEERVERRLAAILAADVAGYSRLMGEDKEGTHAVLTSRRRELSDPKIAARRGRIVKTTGDGLLVEFPSVVDAVRCAVEVQREMALRNADIPEARRIEFRIGINLGDIIIDEHDIYGDGVNVAVRLEALAEPGGICVSRVVRDQVRDKVDFGFEDLGEQQVKNIVRPVRVYRIPLAETARTKAPLPLPDKPSLAVLPFQNMTGDAEQDYFVDGIVEESHRNLAPAVAVRDRPQFEFYVQGPCRRRKAGGARIGRALRARRQRAQSRRSRAHHRPADRYGERRAYLGRPLRRRAG